MSEASLELRKDLARHLRAGHPWVFRKAIEKAPRGLLAGAIVGLLLGETVNLVGVLLLIARERHRAVPAA